MVSKSLIAAAGGLAILMASSAVGAETIKLSAPTVTPVSGGYQWTYHAQEENSPPSSVKTNDFFTIYDIQGLALAATSALTAPTGWAFSSAFVGPTAIGTVPGAFTGDSLLARNVTFTYVGATTIEGAPGSTSAIPLGDFSFISIYNKSEAGTYTSQDHRLLSGVDRASGNIDFIDVPSSAASSVPLPASVVGGAALFSVLGLTRKLRRRA